MYPDLIQNAIAHWMIPKRRDADAATESFRLELRHQFAQAVQPCARQGRFAVRNGFGFDHGAGDALRFIRRVRDRLQALLKRCKLRLLLLDELSLGLAPVVVERLLPRVREYAQESGCGVLLVEQHVRQALNIADRVYVMQRGRIVMSGSAEDVRGRLDEVEATYLSNQDSGAD